MNIGFDIDVVFINQEKFQLKNGIKFLIKRYIDKYYKENNIKLKEKDVCVFDITKKVNYSNIYEKHYIKILNIKL
ncbi:MAG: hypothetical protein ACK5HP_00020 [Bacilli bacterium]